MEQHSYYKYFRVFKYDTVVTEISTNDFIKVKQKSVYRPETIYMLPIDEAMFYGYFKRAKAMEMAKADALKYINKLLAMGKAGKLALYEYRFHHYQDLTINLVEANILTRL